jgi:hypothetical protein
MKKYIFIAILLGQTISLAAQTSRFKDNETLNVWATSGLNMRDKPDAKATKLISIPYGAKVVVQPNIGVKIPFEVEEFKGFTVKGLWLLVKYGDKEGFVFDGFLSRLPAPTKADSLNWGSYLSSKVGEVGKKYEVKIWMRGEQLDTSRFVRPNEKYKDEDIQSYKQKYKQGILESYWEGEGGSASTLELPNCTLYEAYLFVKTYAYDPQTDVFSFNKKDKSINMSVKDEGAGCYYTIKQVGNKAIIDGGCGC